MSPAGAAAEAVDMACREGIPWERSSMVGSALDG